MSETSLTRTELWIGGQWCSPESDNAITVVDPSTELPVGAVPAGSGSDVAKAVLAAAKAFPRWASTSVQERTGYLERLLGELEKRADQFTTVISTEVGAPLALSRDLHVEFGLQTVRSYLQVAADHPFREHAGSSLIVREPVGVVGCITPWNVPLLLILQKIAPALIAGCTVVLKPSEVAPLNAFLLADALAECDLPPGVVNLVSGDGATAGEALASHSGVDMVTLTGSTRAGRRVAELASNTLKRIHLELGGKSATILLDDADLAVAVRSSVDQICVNSGQTCLAWSRMFVPKSQYEQAVTLACEIANGYQVGDPRAPGTDIGPLVSETQLKRVRGHIARGIEEGAELRAGGVDRPAGLNRGYYVTPTVFAKVSNKMAIAREEIFGPVLSITPYQHIDDAVRMANDSPYGLHGSVWSSDEQKAVDAAFRLRTGQVDINGAPFNFSAPFGGYKQSGLGRQCGPYGLDEYHELKAIQLTSQSTPAALHGSIRLRQ